MISAVEGAAAPQRDVWAFLAEPYHLPDWWPGYSGVRPDRKGLAPGARWQVTRSRRPGLLRKPGGEALVVIKTVDPVFELVWHDTQAKLDVGIALAAAGEERTLGDRDRVRPVVAALDRGRPPGGEAVARTAERAHPDRASPCEFHPASPGAATVEPRDPRHGNPRVSRRATKYVFVTGGVVSSLGKGITAASLGRLLKARGLRVQVQKFDPYLNVDPGTMSPFQHGEVFVTEDGAETDLDIGHYERFVDENLTKNANHTSGSIWYAVIRKERKGEYLGSTVQVIPHVTNEIKDRIRRVATASDADVVISEIGGTVGDIESLPFLEAIRQFRREAGAENVLYLHVTYVPFIETAGELKTKPTQHSVNELRRIGIHPDVVVARSVEPLSWDIREKIALFADVDSRAVIVNEDVSDVYLVPQRLREEGLDSLVCDKLGLARGRGRPGRVGRPGRADRPRAPARSRSRSSAST